MAPTQAQTQASLALTGPVTELLLAYLRDAVGRELPVLRFQQPEELYELFASLGVPLDFQASETDHSNEALISAVKAILEHSVCTLHPRFANQNFAGADPVSVLGDWLGAAVNTTAATYEMAPVFTLMERELLKKLAAIARMPEAEGIFSAGGSLSNLFALHLARHRAFPEANTKGLPTKGKLVAFTSSESHYSMKKAIALLGIGYDNLKSIPCNERAEMDLKALEEAIIQTQREGNIPFFINATAGTTVVAGFDDIGAIAALLKRLETQHPIWLHVDGCYGASALFSPTHRRLMEGIEEADSLAWNLHKMMGITQQCSALLVKHKGLLQSCFATGAGYIFQPDKENADLDSGDRHFQCARRVDVLKLWLSWKYRGDEGFTARVDHAVDNAVAFEESLLGYGDGRFVLAHPRTFTNVCFWWVPPSLRGKDISQLGPEEHQLLHALAPAIKKRMQQEGTAMLGFQSNKGRPNFFRMLFINPALEAQDRQAIIDLIDQYGSEHCS